MADQKGEKPKVRVSNVAVQQGPPDNSRVDAKERNLVATISTLNKTEYVERIADTARRCRRQSRWAAFLALLTVLLGVVVLGGIFMIGMSPDVNGSFLDTLISSDGITREAFLFFSLSLVEVFCLLSLALVVRNCLKEARFFRQLSEHYENKRLALLGCADNAEDIRHIVRNLGSGLARNG